MGAAVKTEARKMMLVLLTIVLLLTGVQSRAAQTQKPCDSENLPSAIGDLLRKEFPDWRQKQISDLLTDDQQLWIQAHGKTCPGSIVGHFEKSDSDAYAVLLVPRSETSEGYKLVVFSTSPSTGGATYMWKLLDHSDARTYSGLVISRASAGKYSEAQGTKSVTIKLDGIYLEWIEKGAELFYWSAGRYHKRQVSD
jgi:hypothetical protein